MEAVEEPIPGNSSRLAGNPNWGTATVAGVFAGLLYGGSKEASASVSKDAEVMLKMGSTQDKREQHRLMRDAMEKRFIRVTRGSLIGGMRLGMFTASFFSLRLTILNIFHKDEKHLPRSDPHTIELPSDLLLIPLSSLEESHQHSFQCQVDLSSMEKAHDHFQCQVDPSSLEESHKHFQCQVDPSSMEESHEL